jgi:hypothetical protein
VLWRAVARAAALAALASAGLAVSDPVNAVSTALARTEETTGTVTVHRYELEAGVAADLHPDGTLRLVERAGGRERSLLELALQVPAFPDTAVRHLHAAVSRDGAPGGLRGFTAEADDDGDGRRDEDRLDGRDNDGDGLVDEDYSAISDAMTAITLQGAAGAIQLESYHWFYPHTRGAVAVAFTARAPDGQPLAGSVPCRAAGAAWVSTDLRHERLGLRGALESRFATACVFKVETAGSPTGTVWVGVSALDADRRRDAASRLRAEGNLLMVPFVAGEARIAVAAAPTWPQLACALTSAKAIAQGVRDPVSGGVLPWVVPPVPARSPAELPAARWTGRPDGGGVLELRLEPGRGPLPDFQLFQVGGELLAPPRELTWRSDSGIEKRLKWKPPVFSRGATGGVVYADPYVELLHGELSEAGWLALDYPSGRAAELLDRRAAATATRSGSRGGPTGEQADAADPRERADGLRGCDVDGRPLRFAISTAAAPVGQSADDAVESSRRLRSDQDRPSLSPELLERFPNPFRDIVTVRFRVPETVGEGLVWEDEQKPLLAPETPIPYASVPPRTSVRVYDLGGQEIARLFAESAAPGRYEVRWDGSDPFGRPVASGTYFLKLQVDSWSVTKRIVFLR